MAKIPVLLPPGVEARYRLPFERTIGKNWVSWARRKGWDQLLHQMSQESMNNRDPVTRIVSPYQFHRAIFVGSDYYYHRYLSRWEDEEPDRLDENLILTHILRTAPRRILEIGSGNGHFLEKLMRWQPIGDLLVTLDIDFANMKIADGRINRADIHPDTFPVVGDGRKLPLESQYFDAVISCFGLCHIEGIDSTLQEIHRVLRKDGLFLAVEPIWGSDLHTKGKLGNLLLHLLRSHLNIHQGVYDLSERCQRLGFKNISLQPQTTPTRTYILLSSKKN